MGHDLITEVLETSQLARVSGFFGNSEGHQPKLCVLWQPSAPVVTVWFKRFSLPAGCLV